MRKWKILLMIGMLPFLMGVQADCHDADSQELKDSEAVSRQQQQYAAGQPVPAYDWSLERELLIQLYNLRNQKVATHSVWRSDYGKVEGDCPSMGFGIPYDTSLTNPLMMAHSYQSATSIGQAEPNGIFASTATAATWVMCVDSTGTIEPHYVETKVTVYPGPVSVNYTTNRVKRVGASAVTLDASKKGQAK